MAGIVRPMLQIVEVEDKEITQTAKVRFVLHLSNHDHQGFLAMSLVSRDWGTAAGIVIMNHHRVLAGGNAWFCPLRLPPSQRERWYAALLAGA